MYQFTVNIPSGCLSGLIDGLCHDGGYQELVPDGVGGTMANPVTKAEFAIEEHAKWLRLKYIAQQARTNDATRTAIVNAATVEAEGFSVE
jgi:hypothetical protein